MCWGIAALSFQMICSQLKWAIWSEFPSCLLKPGLCGSMCFAVIPFCLCFSLLSQQPTIQLLLIRPVLFIAHSSAEAFLSLQHYVPLPSLPLSSAPYDSLLSLCLGLDMEERTRQMKLKMNKYKQGAGSDSRLEQDYHKVKSTST